MFRRSRCKTIRNPRFKETELLSIYEIASEILMPDSFSGGVQGRAHKGSVPITDGLFPKPVELAPGVGWLGPRELLALRVSRLTLTEAGIVGYQRKQPPRKVREIARAISEGRVFPPITVALTPGVSGPVVPDGVTRALAGVMARLPVYADVRVLSLGQQQQLFSDQSYGRRLSRNDSVLTGDGPIDLYVQDAFTDPVSPWKGLISLSNQGRYFSPGALATAVAVYAGNAMGEGNITTAVKERFEPEVAHQLATLYHCFGTPETNPIAFSAVAKRAIASAALEVLRRNPAREAKDFERWIMHMKTFPFEKYPHLRNAAPLRDEMIRHWNKRLAEHRRIRI